MTKERLTYQQAGVDPEKAAGILSSFGAYVKTRPRDPALLSGIGPFASCYSLKTIVSEYDDPVLVTSCDGVGTKAKLALDWGLITGLGEDLVAMNVNDLLCVGAKPFLFLDYYACGTLRENQLLPLLKSIQAGCEIAGCSLAGGETAEMPGIYAKEDFDLAGFAVGVAERSAILGAEKVKGGDRLVAIESSGLHSNGFSLVRKLLDRQRIAPEAPAPFGGKSWRDLLLTPTRIYVPLMVPLMKDLHALAHITGGGLFENLPRVLPDGHNAVVASSQWKIPPLFQWIQETADLSTMELLSTLNCGVGMIAVCEPVAAVRVIRALEEKGVRAWDIGTIVEAGGKAPAKVVWE